MLNVNAIGNLTRDPEKTEKGARFTVACSSGKDTVDYLTVYTYGKSAENALEYLHKGNKVAISGRMHCDIRETDDDVYLNEYVNADYVEYLYTGDRKDEEKKTGKYRR